MARTAVAGTGLLNGAEIRRRRKGMKLTMTELAAAAGMSEGYLSRIERETVSEVAVSRAVALARTLGVTVEDLVR